MRRKLPLTGNAVDNQGGLEQLQPSIDGWAAVEGVANKPVVPSEGFESDILGFDDDDEPPYGYRPLRV